LGAQLKALRSSKSLGCSGAHLSENGEWTPCESFAEYKSAIMRVNGHSRLSETELEDWRSRRKRRGKNRKRSGWQNLTERGINGIQTAPNGGLVRGPSGVPVSEASGPISSTGTVIGGTGTAGSPGGFSVASAENDVEVKAINGPYAPRDNDADVFVDIESARQRSRQMGCIGVSRRVSKTGKTVWMPCTNMSDYSRLAGTTDLGRMHQRETTQKIVRTVLKDSVKKKKSSLAYDLHEFKALGRTLRNLSSSSSVSFDVNAIDGDSDGIIQEGTPFKRPATSSAISNAIEKLKPSKEQKTNAISWFGNLSEKDKTNRFGLPLDVLEAMPKEEAQKAVDEFVKNKPKGLKSIGANVNNPEATASNPFNNLGGKAMGRLILNEVDDAHREKTGQKTTYFIGGTTGAGKSIVVDHLQKVGIIPTDKEAAHIDPDFIKLGLPGYNDGAGVMSVHHTSRVATDHVISDAEKAGMDTIIQGTGKRDEHLISAKRAGNKTVGHFVYAPINTATKRQQQRAKETNRNLPSGFPAQIAGEIQHTLDSQIKQGLYDELHIWDNSGDISKGEKPKLIASKIPGKPLVIHDQAKFDDFAGGNSRANRWQQLLNEGDKKLSKE